MRTSTLIALTFASSVGCTNGDGPRDAGALRDADLDVPGVSRPDAGPGTIIVSPDGVVSLFVPDGALPAGVSIDEIRVAPRATPGAYRVDVPGERALVGDFTDADRIAPTLSYELEPAGTTFSVPITVTFRVAAPLTAPSPAVVLESGGALELLDVEAVRPGSSTTEIDVLVPHFSSVSLFGEFPPAAVARFTQPAAGAVFEVGASFDTVVSVTYLADAEWVFVSDAAVMRLVPRPGETARANVQLVQTGSVGPVSQVSGDVNIDPNATVPVTFASSTCSAAGLGAQLAVVSGDLQVDVTEVEIRDGVYGTPTRRGGVGRSRFPPLVAQNDVTCRAPVVPCTSGVGVWVGPTMFTPRAGGCGVSPFTDELEVIVGADGLTSEVEQPSTGDSNSGTAEAEAGGCVLDAASADGRERYALRCDFGAASCAGTNEYTNVAGCTTTSDVEMSLRAQKVEYTAEVERLGRERMRSLSIPGTGALDLATTGGLGAFTGRIGAGAIMEFCVAAGSPTAVRYFPRFSPGYSFVDTAPGCTRVTNIDPARDNGVLILLEAAPTPATVTVTARVP